MRTPLSGLGLCSVIGSPGYENKNDTADHQKTSDPLTEGGLLLEDDT